MSTRSEHPAREPARGERTREVLQRRADPTEQVALVASSRRELLLRAHRFRLRREDLEDCYSQATVELLARSLKGASYASRAHLENAAANYLRASGAPANYRRAILAYNHAGWYVTEVMGWAARYRGSALPQSAFTASQGELEGRPASFLAASPSPVRFVTGERALLAAGHQPLALVPVAVPPAVQAMVVAGNELQRLPYGPGGHPDPRGATEEDCSSTLNYVLYRSGVRSIAEIVRDNPLAQDYVRWGDPGPGRWVTIYATAVPTAHVFIVIAGLRLDTSHAGTDVGPDRAEDGPRWRVFDHIPTWAQWSVRHPPGL